MNISLDIWSKCPLRCPTCPVGTQKATNGERMSVADVDLYLKRIAAQTKIKNVALYMLSDSLIHPDLPDMVRVAHRHSESVYVSTTGNRIECDLNDLVWAKPTRIICGFSGAQASTYARHQLGGRLTSALAFLDRMAELGVGQMLHVTFHRYRDNLDQEEQVRLWALERGFHFFALWASHLSVRDLIEGNGYEGLAAPIGEQLAFVKTQAHYACPLAMRNLAIIPGGDVVTCAYSGEKVGIGNILKDSVTDLLMSKLRPICAECVHAHAYKIISCTSNIGLDKLYAQRSGGDRWKFRIERLKKRVWSKLM